MIAMQPGRLTQRKVGGEHESYAITYHHPTIGKIDVGRISARAGNPMHTDRWSWSIGWVQMPASHNPSGTAPTRRAAETAWKARWPSFRDGFTDAEWFDAKQSQDWSKKKIDIYDARKLTRDPAILDRLRAEMAIATPTPKWIKDLLKK